MLYSYLIEVVTNPRYNYFIGLTFVFFCLQTYYTSESPV